MNEIKHFKLSNGDEVVCDVIEWPDVDGDSPDLVVRNCFQICTSKIKGDGMRYYQFRPWMIYQDDPESFQIINGNHIIGEANPPSELIEQYYKAASAENLTSEDIQEKLTQYIDNLREAFTGDSDTGNKIVVFPGRTKLH
jgi:hypothetical protein